MSCVLGVIARSTSSYTGPAGAIGTLLPGSCPFAEPKQMQDILILCINPLTFFFLRNSDYTTKRNMTTSKISITTKATKPPDRAATFNSPVTVIATPI